MNSGSFFVLGLFITKQLKKWSAFFFLFMKGQGCGC